MRKVVVYAGTRNLYQHMVTAVKSLLKNNPTIDRVYFLIQDDEFPEPLPDVITCINVNGQTWFYTDGVNYNSKWTYMTLMRLALPEILPDEHMALWLDVDTIVVDNIDDPVTLDQDTGAGQVRSLGQVDAAQGVHIAEIAQGVIVAEGLLDRLGAEPCHAGILFDIAIFRQELALFAQAGFRDRCFFQQIIGWDADTQVRIRLLQFLDAVPLGHVIDHVQERGQTGFLAGAVQDGCRTLDQFVIDRFVRIAAGAYTQDHGLFTRTQSRLQNFVLLQASVTTPGRDLVTDRQRRVETIAFLGAEGHRLGGRVHIRAIHVRSALARHGADLRFLGDHLVKGVITKTSLGQFRSAEICPRAILTIEQRHIFGDRGSQQRFAVLPGDHQQDFTELAFAVGIKDAEDHRKERLLPQFQLDQLRGKFPFVVMAEVFNEPGAETWIKTILSITATTTE